MEFISGQSREQLNLFPVCMDDYIDENNPVRIIDAYVESLNMKELGFQKSQPNDTGRPMYSPKDLLKLYIYGYMNRVRSSRKLEIETKRNLEVIWLLKNLTPDHKTISRFRQNNPSARTYHRVHRRTGTFCLSSGKKYFCLSYGRSFISKFL